MNWSWELKALLDIIAAKDYNNIFRGNLSSDGCLWYLENNQKICYFLIPNVSLLFIGITVKGSWLPYWTKVSNNMSGLRYSPLESVSFSLTTMTGNSSARWLGSLCYDYTQMNHDFSCHFPFYYRWSGAKHTNLEKHDNIWRDEFKMPTQTL